MVAHRAEKATVRRLWMEKLAIHDLNCPPDDLLYVFLPGSEGYEIELLHQYRLIERTETGGIAQNYMGRIAAIESNKLAIAALQKRFPGLKIYETNFRDLIRGDGLVAYPQGEHRHCCRARVINLDLNEILSVEEAEQSFPIIRWIQKLGEMHAAAPRLNWSLYLTLHGEIRWSNAVCEAVRQFLRENFRRAEIFADRSRIILGNEIFDLIAADRALDFSSLSRDLQQKILMLFVPKKIAETVRPQLWRLETEENLRYGRRGHAPMVTWIIHFRYDQRAGARPDAIYIESVNQALRFVGRIDETGEVFRDIE